MRNLVVLLLIVFVSEGFSAAEKYKFKSKLNAKIHKRSHVGRLLGDLSMSRFNCEATGLVALKSMPKQIIPFTVGTKIKANDVYGASTRSYVDGEYGQYAKLGLPDNHSYEVRKMQSQYAIHSDPRCEKYVKITRIDKTTYKGKLCRRIGFKLGKLQYNTLFCMGDNKGYVDHFGLTKSI